VKRAALLLAGALALGACSLAGDITPPPGLATAQAQGTGLPPTAAPLTAPQRAPDLVAGERIYVEKCAPCHGVAGDGLGPQAASLPNPPAALANPDVAQRAVPQDWYAVVTEGRIESFMPPFASLDDGQRWDVVGYALSLGLPADQVETGRGLFQQNCVACHGDRGQGQGDVLDLTAPDILASRSLLALYGAITEGAGAAMPGFSDQLNDQERWALSAYVRSLALAGEPQAATATPTSETAPSQSPTSTLGGAAATAAPAGTASVPTESVSALGRITGQLINGTAGAGAPTDLEVTLHGLDGNVEALTESQRVGPAGSFAFDGLEPTAGRSYVVTADYQGVLYATDIGELPAGSNDLELPLTVYETTTETKDVQVGRLHLLFNFPTKDVVQVVELWLLSNLGDRTVYGGDTGLIEVDLPPGATGLSLDGGTIGDRFELTPTGFRDRRELIPGENTGELVFSYNLPYDGSLDIVRRPAYPVAATVAMVPGGGPEVIGQGFTDTGLRQISGASLHSYERGPAQAGDEIALTLRGRAAAAGSAPTSGVQPIVFGAAALVLALIGAGLIWFRPRRRAAPAAVQPATTVEPVPDEDRILWAIASLDNEFAAGKIDLASYQARRAELLKSLPTAKDGRAQAADGD
jgi:mono/diheme cytochrome c family protein